MQTSLAVSTDGPTEVLDQAVGHEHARPFRWLQRMQFCCIDGRGRQHHSKGCQKRLGLAMEGSAKIAEAERKENEFSARQDEATGGDAKRQRIEEGLAEIVPFIDGEAARAGEDLPLEITAKRVPKRLSGAWDAVDDEPDAWTKQADAGMKQFSQWRLDGPETKRMRTRGIEVNDDPDEEDARPEEGEWETDDLSGEVIDASEVRAVLKEETEFMNEIELCEDSTAEDCWSSGRQ